MSAGDAGPPNSEPLPQAAGSLAAAIDAVLKLSRRTLKADAYAIWRQAADSDAWHIAADYGLSPGFVRDVPQGSRDLPTGLIAVEDVFETPRLAFRRESYEAEGIRSFLCVPLSVVGENRCTVTFYYREPRTFSEEERETAESLAELSGTALTAAELYEEQRRLRAGAERMRLRAEFLSEAGRSLASSLDYQETLEHASRLLVPRLADWCIVHLLDDAGVPQPVVITHADPEKIRWARSLQGRYQTNPDSDQGVYRVLRSGQPELHAEITEAMLTAAARDEEHLHILHELGLKSVIIVPLRGREKVLGAISLIASEAVSRFESADLELAQQFAERVALAVEHADLYRRTREMLQQERLLHEAMERLAAIVSSSEDAIMSKDLEGTILTWNEAAERMYGYAAQEMIGQPVMRLIPPERHSEEARILARLQCGERVEHFESVRVRKDGRRIEVSVAVSPVRDPAGRIIGASKIARDITERKRLEAELQSRTEEVEAQREELEMQNEELTAQNEELARADQAKDAFVAMLAHELRNPLAPIQNAVYLLGPKIPEEPVAQRHRRTIERQLRSLTRLVDDLLEASRVSRGLVALRRELLDVSQVAGAAADALNDYMVERGHTLTVHLPSVPVLVQGDPLRLEQVVINLLNNAAKFTDPGGKIDFRVETVNGDACIRVRDSGIGISPDLLPRVFDLFTQGDQGLARTRGGLGIGLNVVRNLVEMHSGNVTAHSEGIGLGTEVVVTLPLAAPVSDPSASANGSDAGRAEVPAFNRRVLVVDDNRDTADTMTDLLREWGLEVAVAYNGAHALQIAEQERPGTIILDIGMPGMDGYEVARLLRSSPWGDRCRLIALTGYGAPDDRQRAQHAGFDAHLTKPVDPHQLQALLAGEG